MKSMERFRKHGLLIGLLIVVLVTASLFIGYLMAPTVVYDHFIWKYYWGPVVADAAGEPAMFHGVVAEEGYTLVSELTYGVILVAALFVIYELLKKLKIVIDWKFCLALLPYIIFGPAMRVLEDAQYFQEPLVYWFISPLIYLQIAVYALGFLLIGYYLQKASIKKSPKVSLYCLCALFGTIDVCYALAWFLGVPYGLYIIHPLIFFLLSVFSLVPVLYVWFKHQTLTINTVIFSGGLLCLLPSVYLIARWIAGEQWAQSYGVRFDVFALVLGLVSLIVVGVYLIAQKYKKYSSLAAYKQPLNLAMIAGHMIDGIASYVSIYDPLNMNIIKYVEKHPASNFLMEVWPPLFPIMKFVLIIVVIYVFDVLYRKELQQHMRLVNLLKIGILILGFSPGLRDLLRVTMGV
ncbi:MAG: DUF63 family protein [Candidatus Thermoplasmatota archaeon]|nr:DUF63 family protein [Candidatus Thermoplasmatota archaeon]